FFSSRRRHTISKRDWSSDVCSSDLFQLISIESSDSLKVACKSETESNLSCLSDTLSGSVPLTNNYFTILLLDDNELAKTGGSEPFSISNSTTDSGFTKLVVSLSFDNLLIVWLNKSCETVGDSIIRSFSL